MIRSALVDLSSRSEAPPSGGLGMPRTPGAVPVGQLPLHNVVISRLTARSPSPSMPSMAKITQVLPSSGSRPQASASCRDATTCS
jgi:hypothetical protein